DSGQVSARLRHFLRPTVLSFGRAAMPVVVCQCAGKPLRVKAAASRGLPIQRLDFLELARSVMIEERSARIAPKGDIDYRLLIPFLPHVVLLQTLILVIHITTSYRAIELGLPVLWLGIVATGFAIIPVFTALQVGRWIDRGNDARAAWLGSAL